MATVTTATAGVGLQYIEAGRRKRLASDDTLALTLTALQLAGSTTLTVGGGITSGANIVSDTDSTDDLGTTSVRWANVYTDSIGDSGQALAVAATTVNMAAGTLSFDGTHSIDTSGNNGLTISSGTATMTLTAGNVAVGTDLTVGGNLTVNGTTTTVNSTVVSVDDPIFNLGGDTAPGSDDNKDRGITFQWHNGTAAKVGFFGYDDSASEFTFIPDASVSGEVISGTVGNAKFGTIAGTLSTAAQTNITSLGALTALTVDDVAIDGKIITMTGSASDTVVMTAATNGAFSLVTTDAAGTSANIQITADGTAELAGTTVTLDSSGGITLDADNGTITFSDAGSSLGTITSSGWTGAVVGNVTGNCSGTAATVTGGTQANITTCANLATIGTVTSGTLSTGAVLADVTMTLGTDADGDIYYRASNKLARLGKGTAGQVLQMNSGATAPEWGSGSAASTGTTNATYTIRSGSATADTDGVLYIESGDGSNFSRTTIKYEVDTNGLGGSNDTSGTMGDLIFSSQISPNMGISFGQKTGLSMAMKAGENLTAGNVVYMHTDGKVYHADASVEAEANAVIGIVHPDGGNITQASDDNVDVVTFSGLQIAAPSTTAWVQTGGSAVNEGDTVYLSSTDGVLTITPPTTAGDWVVPLGVVAKKGDGSSTKDVVIFRLGEAVEI